MRRLPRLIDERRSIVYGIVLGIWLELLLLVLVHDQFLIRLAPEHFTVFHPPLWGIENESLLAAAWALRASISPGLGVGLAVAFVARGGSRPRISVGECLRRGAGWLLAAVAVAWAAGGAAWWWGWKPLPDGWYPDPSRELMTSQTVQVTLYLSATLASMALLIQLARRRRWLG